VLLRAVVEVALDPAAFGIGGRDEPRARRPELADLEAQPVEQLPLRPDVSSFQADRPPDRELRKLSAIAACASSGPAPHLADASLPCTRLRAR
jgi:hypothetical protein